MMTITFFITMIIPILFSYLIDDIVMNKNFNQLSTWLVITLPIAVVGTVMEYYFIQYIPIKIGISNSFLLQKNSLNSILHMNQTLYSKNDKGYYYNVNMNSCSSYGDIHEEVHLNLFSNIIFVSIILIFVTYINRIFGLFFFIYGIILVIISIFEAKPLYELQKNAMVVQDVYLSDLRNIIENKNNINSLHTEHFFQNLFEKSVNKYQVFLLKYKFFMFLGQYAPKGINQIFNIIFLFVAALLVQKSQITPGVMLMGYQYLGYIVTPITDICGILMRYKSNKIHIERVDQLEEDAVLEKENEPYKTQKDLLFKANKFDFYKGDNNKEDYLYHIEDLGLKINGLYIIKGENGSGKSMLLNLMFGNISPKNCNGEFSLYHKIEETAFLTYPTFTINGNIEENLFGIPYNKELEKILNIDYKDKEITSNPINLSYGQQQKLALMRIFGTNAPILFLDEPLSNLDAETQKRVIDYLKLLKGKKTLLVVMHSNELDEYADAILQINNQIMECMNNSIE